MRDEQRWPCTLWIARHGQSAGNVARDAAQAARALSIAYDVRDADIRAFIADAAKVTGRTFIIDNRVQGKVTVVTDRPLSRSEYLEIFLATLRSNGLVAVPSANGAFRVQPIDNAASQPGRVGSAGASRNSFVTEIVRLRSIDATSAVVVPIPAPLQKLGIGGVLSPQALATDERAVVLDFRKGQMSDARLADALRMLEAEPGTALAGEVRSCGPGGGALPFLRANVGGADVEAQVDTGASQTTVRVGSGRSR